MDKIGQRIKHRRLVLGVNQKELAMLVGCTQAHISRIEHGESLSIVLLERISFVLGCEIYEIIGAGGNNAKNRL
jgi:transcriptional regulator with XRE-family HTH domain